MPDLMERATLPRPSCDAVPDHRAVIRAIEPAVEANLDLLIRLDKAWQPTDYLPNLEAEDWREQLERFRQTAATISDALLVVLVGDMVTEEALPGYAVALNALVRDDEGTSPAPWARWLRGWTAEENRHGDLLNAYLRLTGRVDMRAVERTVHHLIASGFNPKSRADPYNLLVYTSFQERATRISHGNVGRIAGRQGDPNLTRICGMIAGDEARHEAFYTRMMALVLDHDPAGGILAFRSMLRGRIAMPGRFMDDGSDPDVFDHFAIVAQRTNVYTAHDYASIIEHLVRTWNIAGRAVTGLAAQAQDELCRQSERYARVAERTAATLGKQPPVAFSWLRNRRDRQDLPRRTQKECDMRVLVTGATGFIGRALIPLLQREGHSVVAWVRSEARARSLVGADVELVAAHAGLDALISAIERCDAVVNLAGEPLLGGRWTAARRATLERSRVEVTDLLVRAMARARTRPATLISGSAVGYYGDREDEALDEASSGGDDFLARLCRRWESAARSAESFGVRVVLLRTGIVLGRAGGALAQMQPPFELGLGGPVGSGRQFVPWIHLHDLVKIIAVALVDERYRGPVNGVAPEQATSRAFAQALGRALHRPAMLPLPALALKAIFGQAHTVLVASQRVVPRALGERQFAFDFPTLDAALADIVGGPCVSISTAQSRPEGAAAARYVLRARTIVDAPLAETFAFFSKAENLGLITPAAMAFSIQGQGPPMAQGARIDYHVRVGGLRVRWRTLITTWEPGRRFVDLQEAGPYRVWWHEHSFAAAGERTVMEDRVYYAPPFGLLGRLVHRLFIGRTLRKVFQYRGDVIRLRFGVS